MESSQFECFGEHVQPIPNVWGLNAQFDTDKVLQISYKDYSDIASQALQDISEVGGLGDMLIPGSDQDAPACPGVTLRLCLAKSATCKGIHFAEANSSFSFNCTKPSCLADCDECGLACKCCYMLVLLKDMQGEAGALTTTFMSLDNTIKELQRNLSNELDLTRKGSFHSLLEQAQHTSNFFEYE